MYEAVKTVHVATVLISISLFTLRMIWMYTAPNLLRSRFSRFAPHTNDTVLLASGIWLSVLIAQYPFVHLWITAKIVLLLVYIGLGMVALKRGKTIVTRAGAGIAAILVYSYIVSIALTKSVNPLALFLAFL